MKAIQVLAVCLVGWPAAALAGGAPTGMTVNHSAVPTFTASSHITSNSISHTPSIAPILSTVGHAQPPTVAKVPATNSMHWAAGNRIAYKINTRIESGKGIGKYEVHAKDIKLPKNVADTLRNAKNITKDMGSSVTIYKFSKNVLGIREQTPALRDEKMGINDRKMASLTLFNKQGIELGSGQRTGKGMYTWTSARDPNEPFGTKK